MIVFVDDLRNPEHYYDTRGKNAVWVKSLDEAIEFLNLNSNEVTELHLDEYLGDDFMDRGSALLERVAFDYTHGFCYFPLGWGKLEKIYLHSSDRSVITRLIKSWGKWFSKPNVFYKTPVELIDNSKD